MKKTTLYVLNINDYSPAIRARTYPLLRYYAHRIGARWHEITERRWPHAPVVYEKFQIYYLSALHQDDWSIYVDSDALVHPETIDFTEHLPRDTVMHNGADMGAVRWQWDDYFRRDGRHIGSCNWFTLASGWCRDLWHPLEDLSVSEAIARIRPTMKELGFLEPAHLLDDYVCSRNIARFGLKFTTVIDLLPVLGLSGASFLWHVYDLPEDEKVRQIDKVLGEWNLPAAIRQFGA